MNGTIVQLVTFYLSIKMFLLTQDLLELPCSAASASTLRARLEKGGIRRVSSDGESSQLISVASFNVPSALL